MKFMKTIGAAAPSTGRDVLLGPGASVAGRGFLRRRSRGRCDQPGHDGALQRHERGAIRALPEEEAVEKTRHHILDTFAAMISGSDLPPARAAYAFARRSLLMRAASIAAMGLLALATSNLTLAQSATPSMRVAQAPADKAAPRDGQAAPADKGAPASKDDDDDGDDDDDVAPAGNGDGKRADAKQDHADDKDRFPQPVRVGDLIGRAVIAPQESQNLIGRVRKVVRNGDGEISVVMSYGGYFGFGTHLICVSIDDLALTGYAIQAKEIEESELARLPVCDGGGNMLAADATIKVNLAKPAH